jgi:tetratricopeptide (TPR) repeat protein
MNRAQKRRNKKLFRKSGKTVKVVQSEAPPGQLILTIDQQAFTIVQAIDLGVQHYSDGNLPKAEKIFQHILQADPNQSDALYLLGVIAHQVGKYDIAVDLIGKSLAINPDFSEAHLNLGSTLQQLGRLDEAVASYRQAIALEPEFVVSYTNLSGALRELGRLDESEASCRRAIELEPNYAKAHDNLGATLRELGRLDEAVASCRRAIELEPNYAGTYSNMGVTLRELGRSDEAAASYRQAIALNPDYVEAIYNLGQVLFEEKHYKEAAEQFTLVDSDLSKDYLLKCLYLQDQQSNFYDQLDHMVNQGKNNAMIGSLISRSNIRYGSDKHNPFCNEPLKYVLQTNLSEQCDFKTIFIEGAVGILGDEKVLHRRQDLLMEGFQTAGNVFTQLGPDTDVIQNVIRSELEKYRVGFKDSEEGLITSWPTDYSLNGWLVCMKSGGALNPHIHERGWLSGSIYINVPPKLNTDSGNLVVCLDDEKDRSGGDDNSQSIDVVTGSLCLFPSSLHHYTIPFKSKEERIVLAFDVVPNI